MRRLFWLGLGAAAGVYGMRRLTSAAHAYTPAGLAEGLAGLGAGLREMAEVVREGMAEREGELRVALGIDTGIDTGTGVESSAGRALPASLSPERAQRLVEDRAGPDGRTGAARRAR